MIDQPEGEMPGFFCHYYEAECGPERYIEAQLWADRPIADYLSSTRSKG